MGSNDKMIESTDPEIEDQDEHSYKQSWFKRKSVKKKTMNASLQKHLANRISDIQNRRYSKQTSFGLGGNASPSSKCSEMKELGIDIISREISGDDTPYIPIFVYIIHCCSSVWFLMDAYFFVFEIERFALFIQILFYLNASVFCILELWKLFVGITFSLKSVFDVNKHQKIEVTHLWRIQFWIFVPLIWLTNKASYYLFSTLSISTIHIWFDFIVHHIWMLLLWIIYILYPYTNEQRKILEFHFMENISSILYLCSFCLMLIVSCIVRSRSKVSKNNKLCC